MDCGYLPQGQLEAPSVHGQQLTPGTKQFGQKDKARLRLQIVAQWLGERSSCQQRGRRLWRYCLLLCAVLLNSQPVEARAILWRSQAATKLGCNQNSAEDALKGVAKAANGASPHQPQGELSGARACFKYEDPLRWASVFPANHPQLHPGTGWAALCIFFCLLETTAIWFR